MKNEKGQTSKPLLVMVIGSTFLPSFLNSPPIHTREKVQLCSMFVHIKFFLKNTFCSNKVWSIKLQSAQAEGTEYKHIGKQSSKVTRKRKNLEFKTP